MDTDKCIYSINFFIFFQIRSTIISETSLWGELRFYLAEKGVWSSGMILA